MALSIGGLLYVMLLLLNAMAVLHEERFLARIGWGPQSVTGYNDFQSQNSVKMKLINLMSAVRTLMRIPLIALNTVVIVYELILG
ncbi:Yos1-like protein [Paraphysoderma sedebokerense]|nr:Yos1-like protein [Paraphysoderma sedebokerense]